MKKLEPEEMYKVILEKPNGEQEERTYRKASEKFEGEYAVVKAYSKDTKYANQVWYGVINQEYQTIIPFRLWSQIELLEDQALVQDNSYDKNSPFPKKRTWHVQLNPWGIQQRNVLGPYQKVKDKNNTTSKTVIQAETKEGLRYLYHLPSGERISSFFTEIQEFEEVDGEMIAFAVRKFPVEDIYRIPMEMKCYIDLNGTPWSETYTTYSNRTRYLSKQEFDFCYQETLKEMKYQYDANKRDPMIILKKLKQRAKPISESNPDQE